MMAKATYGSVAGALVEAPCTLTLTEGDAKALLKFLAEKEVTLRSIEDPVWAVWAVLDDLYPADE